ncbi:MULTISPECIES: SemiSWEET transporter [unclassified Undibacterium]|uniref:SemiSWEET family sugar transporter n=1 Tax=unclassified Undibacterium TaxID=2630295 RepID=UPI002AC9A37C|nr:MULTISPECIES: SemiSWEET transporter [unclassified Undibacterium]MEB0139383.1 SemiSWEET transporter [Undibacterium sp. CCC2.1]MEB0173352.1 SemiSWEET transporter [Undibacterium sp. CCC1.1]MEB0177261.1 SemiSWEET transporter [Undibacterium sp. CCC3.4]MEB0216526.1 SemiSWEET transporter [Undibacterium sp. 5I2]WPX44046.1 SemiSWEET transporter [Undibacterium sp. CCC3.4]
MELSDLVGYAAASLTTAAFIPQAWLTWRAKRADGVSLSMYVIFVFGIALWATYGFLLQAWPIIIANIITLILAIFILVMKVVYK